MQAEMVLAQQVQADLLAAKQKALQEEQEVIAITLLLLTFWHCPRQSLKHAVINIFNMLILTS